MQDKKWYIVDAQDVVLGRLAAEVANRLRGKHKPKYTTHLDVGDFVIVINADKVKVTGSKLTQKFYFRHSGYPGGARETRLDKVLQDNPERVIEHAVRGMLPGNSLGRQQFRKLKVYAGDKHPHVAQQPEVLTIKQAN